MQRLKQIKIPALFKKPPAGVDAADMLINNPVIIKAHSVRNELPFFLDQNGYLSLSKTNSLHEIIPDVTFFDENEKPILFIELVATHHLTKKKRKLFHHFGIDTVQVSIPKENPKKIEKAFEITQYTKWVYNYEQEITEFILVSRDAGERVQNADEQQADIFRELVSCRRNRIKTLIRQFGKIIRSEYYQGIERSITEELYSIESSGEKERSEIERIQSAIRKQHDSFREAGADLEEQSGREYANIRARAKENLSGQYADEQDRIETRRKEIAGQQDDLETRYHRKREQLEGRRKELQTEQGELSRAINSETETKTIIGEVIEASKLSINASRSTKSEIERISVQLRKAKQDHEADIKRGLNELREQYAKEEEQVDEQLSGERNEEVEDPEFLRKQKLIHDFIKIESEEERLRSLIRAARERAY